MMMTICLNNNDDDNHGGDDDGENVFWAQAMERLIIVNRIDDAHVNRRQWIELAINIKKGKRRWWWRFYDDHNYFDDGKDEDEDKPTFFAVFQNHDISPVKTWQPLLSFTKIDLCYTDEKSNWYS